MFVLIFDLYTLILLVLVVEHGVFDLESRNEARVVPEEGALWADYRVYLSHRLHDLELVVVQLGRHQVYIPHCEVGVEKDD